MRTRSPWAFARNESLLTDKRRPEDPSVNKEAKGDASPSKKLHYKPQRCFNFQQTGFSDKMANWIQRKWQDGCESVQGDAHPPATATHSARQLPCLPSTSTISVSHLQRQPTPFSLTGSHVAQYSSSSIRFFSSSVVISRYGMRASCRAGAFAGQC